FLEVDLAPSESTNLLPARARQDQEFNDCSMGVPAERVTDRYEFGIGQYSVAGLFLSPLGVGNRIIIDDALTDEPHKETREARLQPAPRRSASPDRDVC